MADPLTHLQQAEDAYDTSLQALDQVHDTQKAILAAVPVDWNAYQAATDAMTEVRATADAAQAVYEAAILDTPAVATLLATLTTVTADMKERAAALKAEAETLAALAKAADLVTSTLGLIAKFV